MIPIYLVSLSFIYPLYGQIPSMEVVFFTEMTSTPIVQQTVEVIADYDDQAALLNISIPFTNDECQNPVVRIEREGIDYTNEEEYLDIYFGAFRSENLLTQCGEGGDDEVEGLCEAFFLCGEFQIPVGVYTMLEFFVFQSDEVGSACGDDEDEEGPERSTRLRLTVSCQVDVECQVESAESASGSSSESADNAMRSVENILENDYNDHKVQHRKSKKEENIPIHIDCQTYYNFLWMIVICVCFCWIAQCSVLCRYGKK